MKNSKRRHILRQSRHRRVRRKVHGTAERPRLCVFRSNKHIYVQVTDDWKQHTLLSCSTLSPELRGELEHGGSVQSAAKVGELIGRKCLEAGITAVVFDRGGYRYHGRVKALAEAAREQFTKAGAPGF